MKGRIPFIRLSNRRLRLHGRRFPTTADMSFPEIRQDVVKAVMQVVALVWTGEFSDGGSVGRQDSAIPGKLASVANSVEIVDGTVKVDTKYSMGKFRK